MTRTRSLTREEAKNSLTTVNWYVWKDDVPTLVRPALPEEIDSQTTIDGGELVSDPAVFITSLGRAIVYGTGTTPPRSESISFRLEVRGGVMEHSPVGIEISSWDDAMALVSALRTATDLVFGGV